MALRYKSEKDIPAYLREKILQQECMKQECKKSVPVESPPSQKTVHRGIEFVVLYTVFAGVLIFLLLYLIPFSW